MRVTVWHDLVYNINIYIYTETVWQYLHLFICLEDDINLRKCCLKFLSYHLVSLEHLGLKPMGLERCFTTTTPGSPTLLNTAHVVVDEVLHWREIICDFQAFYIILDSIFTSLNTFMSWASCSFLPKLPEYCSFFSKLDQACSICM